MAFFTLNEYRFKINDARWANVTDQWKNFVSLYPYNRLYFITEGEAAISLKDTQIHLRPGYCYLLPSFQIVTANCKKSMTHYFIHFQEPENSPFPLFDFYKTPREIKVDYDLTLTLFQTAVANRNQQTLEEYFYLHGAFNMLIAPFFANVQQNIGEDPRLLKTIEYINSHIEENIQISELANIISLTVNHYSHLFKTNFGISPKKYILQKKLEYAQSLLAKSFYNVNEIAHKLGFDNETYFSRLFREKIGIPPSDYKKQLSKSSQNTFKKI